MNIENKDKVLSGEDKIRFARHIMLPEVGEEGQKRLKAARVLIVGIGGLGAPAALYLASAGVGTIGLVDDDVVDVTNLHRQVLYDTNDIGSKKTKAAATRLQAIHPDIHLEQYSEKLTPENALDLIKNYDVVLDGTDNFTAHYILNDACVLANKILVYGNVYRFEGQVGVVVPKQGPCYRCLYPVEPPPGVAPSCADAGVLGVVPGLIGMMQALEVLKIILKIGQPAADHLMRFDALGTGFRDIKILRDEECAVCGDQPSIKELTATDDELICSTISEMTADTLQVALHSNHPPLLLDVRDLHEYESRHLQGARLIPLAVLPERFHELDKAREIVVYCHSGMRSAHALRLLQSHGYTKVWHLKGGIMSMPEAGQRS